MDITVRKELIEYNMNPAALFNPISSILKASQANSVEKNGFEANAETCRF